MRRYIILSLFFLVQQMGFTEEWRGLSKYYPEGTTWTEIVLDTLLHDDWYSYVEERWVANFDTVTYFVHGDTIIHKQIQNKVYLRRSGMPDSLVFYICDGGRSGLGEDLDFEALFIGAMRSDNAYFMDPRMYMQFDWKPGKYFRGTACLEDGQSVGYSIPDEIKTGYFGGIKPLNYVDVTATMYTSKIYTYPDPVRILQGIGVTSWNGYEAVFGPMNARYAVWRHTSLYMPSFPYRSMLVHFERDGEVLYDVWPQPEGTGVVPLSVSPEGEKTAVYDLQGRRLNAKPQRGLYIQGGKMRMAW